MKIEAAAPFHYAKFGGHSVHESIFDSLLRRSGLSAVFGVVYVCNRIVGSIWVPRSVDNVLSAPVGLAVLIDVALLGVFAIQHSVMARPAFKRWWTRFVLSSIERSTYVVLASGALLLLYWQWRTLPGIVWDVGLPAGRVLLWAFLARLGDGVLLLLHGELLRPVRAAAGIPGLAWKALLRLGLSC